MSTITSAVSDVVALTASGGDDILAFEALISPGRTIHLSDALYKLSRELHVDVSECHIIGTGSTTTEIRRITNTGDAVIRWGAPDSATIPLSTWPVIGGGLERVKLQANGLADYGLHQKVHYRGVFSGLLISNPRVTGHHVTTLTNAVADVTHFAYNEVTDCEYRDMRIFVTGTAKGLDIGGSPSQVGGQAAYHNRYYGLRVQYDSTGVGIFVRDADDIFFFGWAVGCNDNGGGTAVELNGGTALANARNCTFTGGGGLTQSQVIIARGGANYPSRNNLFLGLSTEDAVGPTITIEKGATCDVVWNNGASTLVRDLNSSSIEDEMAGAASGGIGSWGWTNVGAGTTGYFATEAQHPGIAGVTSSGTGLCGMIGSPVDIGTLHPNSANFDLHMIAKASSGSDATTMYRIGWGNDPTADPPDDGLWYEKLYADTQWFAVTSLGGTKSRTAIASVTVNWVHFRILRHYTSTSGWVIGSFGMNETLNAVLFNLNGAWPTTLLSPFLQVRNSAGSVRTFRADYFRQTITGMTRA